MPLLGSPLSHTISISLSLSNISLSLLNHTLIHTKPLVFLGSREMARTTDLTDVVVRRGSVFLGGCAAFSSLPLAAFAIIIAKLDLVSYDQLSMTCRSLYLLLQSDEVWDVLVQRDYPTSLYTLAQQVDDRLDDLLMPSPFVHYRPAVMLEPASQSSRSVYVALHCYFKNAARWFRRVCDELHQASLVLDSLGRWSCPSCLRFACRCSNAHLVYTAHGYLQWLENHTVLRNSISASTSKLTGHENVDGSLAQPRIPTHQHRVYPMVAISKRSNLLHGLVLDSR